MITRAILGGCNTVFAAHMSYCSLCRALAQIDMGTPRKCHNHTTGFPKVRHQHPTKTERIE